MKQFIHLPRQASGHAILPAKDMQVDLEGGMARLMAMSVVCGCFSAMAAPGLIRTIDLAQGWSYQTKGAWRVRYDHRDLLAMRHPWTASGEGDFASASLRVTIPEQWQGPVSLTFYCSDDYNTDNWRPDGSWLTAEGFIGHRFKQVLVNDRVVWSADISDPVEKGVSPRHRIALPVDPGETFLLTLLVYDKVPSATVLEHDFYQSANDEMKRGDDAKAANFQSHVYWGDLCLADADAEPMPGKRPSEAKVLAVHNKRWPLPPFGDPWEQPVAPLEVSAPEGIPEQGFPVQCGIPIHAGKLTGLDKVRLQVSEKQGVTAQKAVIGRWPDESIQWVLFDFPLKPGVDALQLAFDQDRLKFSEKVIVTEQAAGVTVDTGLVQFDASPGDALENIRFRKGAKVEAVRLSIRLMDDVIPGTTESVTVIDKGPFRARLQLDGRFDALDRTVGSFRLYCSAYAGLPYIKCWFRLLNDTLTDLPVSGLKVEFALPSGPTGLRVPSGDVHNGFALVQRSEQSRELNGEPVGATTPMFLAWDDGVITVRNFRELYPKQAAAEGDSLIIDLVAAKQAPIVFTPGEAKSHEVWLALGKIDPAQFAATVRRPPILQNAAYFCSTGVIGPARPHDGVPVLHEHMVNDFGDKQWEHFDQRFGVRDFPDSPYYGGLPKWSNNYYERMLNLWSEWFLSGDRSWYDLAFDVCRHLLDVAIVHSEVPGKDWIGAIHGPGENHVNGPWNPNLRIAGLALYQKLTGDPDAREAFLGVGDFCVRICAGIDGGSVRQQAGPFDAICTAYAETRETQFLDDGADRVESVLRAMDIRRGVWPDEHGSKVYRGNIPWMVAQVARPLYLWYCATGDVVAAQALVGLAESIVCENTDWDQPGVVSGYSHNPHFDVSASYDLLIIPVICAAYELTEDPFFLDAAKAQWERWTREKAFDSPLNCYWNTPWLVWYLKEYDLLEPGQHPPEQPAQIPAENADQVPEP